MHALMMLLLSVVAPTWMPSVPVAQDLAEFQQQMEPLSDEARPSTDLEVNCFWTAKLIGTHAKQARDFKDTSPEALRARQIYYEARKYNDDHCKGQGAESFNAKLVRSMIEATKNAGKKVPSARAAAPFPLPPLPDKAGNDLGAQLWVMFEGLELRLASGGHQLAGDARACAWASAALAGAEAVQRTKGATPGIGAGVPVLQARHTATCQGEALRAKEAAWAWLRANPGATQPLEVAQRPPSSPWPAGPGDGLLWVGAALLFSVAPEAAPALLLAQ